MSYFYDGSPYDGSTFLEGSIGGTSFITTDAFSFIDQTLLSVQWYSVDGILFAAIPQVVISWGTQDGITLSSAATAILQTSFASVDTLSLADLITNVYPATITEAMVLNDTSVHTLYAVMPVIESLSFADQAASQYTLTLAVATQLVLQSIIDNIKVFEELADTVEFADVINEAIIAVAHVLDSLQFATDVTTTLRIFTSAEDIIELISSVTQQHLASDAVEDTISFFGSLSLGGEQYTVWAVHPSYPAATEYDNFEFNSFAKAGSKYLAASRDGIYEFGGSSDAGADIAAVVRTGLFDFGATQLKQVVRAYLGYTSSNRLVLKTIATDGGQKIERWYELQDKTADDIRESRIKFGKGVKSRYWQFELINVDGGQFEIDQLHLMPLMLSRRVKE